MSQRIKRWGDNAFIPIPKLFMDQLGLDKHTRMMIRIEKGRIIITPVSYRLDELLDKGEAHFEGNSGSPAGKEEVWW